jgi:dual specificity protein kinase YAK1
MQPHEYVSQHGQGRYVDNVSYSHSDAYVRGHTGYSQNAGPTHSSWRPQMGSRSGSMEASSSHGPSHAFHSQAPLTRSFDFLPNTSAPSVLDPVNWDPDFRSDKIRSAFFLVLNL